MTLATPTVYIPTLAGGERLATCLDSLLSQTVPVEVVVADNGPGEGCSSMLEARFPNVKRIAFEGRNLGFGAAVNRAVARHGEGPVILLNDDTRARPDFVERLVAAWDGGACAMVAGVLLRAGDPGVIDSAGISCDRSLTAWDYLTGEPAGRLAAAADPFGPTGGGALYDRDAFDRVGGFDERMFLYYEDLDLALRLSLDGHSCRLARDAFALHEGSATLGRRHTEKYRQTGFGRGYLLRKYGVMRDPKLALEVILSDATAALAQLLLDHTLAGAGGRIEGWRAARNVPRLEPPVDRLATASLRSHTRVRIARRRG